ncbi:MAG TPA: hypothetical protein VFP88_03540 [Rhodanobacteraceae bacterium]|nr:hypothetical protein [Rhodanobacteraceae bacterium]
MNAWLNRDLILGRWAQCWARAGQVRARICRNAQLDARSAGEYLHASLRARYGHDRARAEWRLRRLERGA